MSTKFCGDIRTDCHYYKDGVCRSQNFCRHQTQVYDEESAVEIQLAYMTRVLRRLDQVQKQLTALELNALETQIKHK